jgi:Xaa-Pro aminopeptidase
MERIKRLRSAMRKARIQALFVTDLTNIEYLSGIRVSVGFMLVSMKAATLFVDKRYREMALKRAESDIDVSDASLAFKALKACRSFAIEADTMSVEQYENLKAKFKNKKIVQTSDLIKGLRRFKDSSEISKMKQAMSISLAALRKVPRLLRRGMTERELAWAIESECRRLGADGMAFDTIVAFGSNTSRPHHRPTSRMFKKGDLIQVDMGAKVRSYCSDYSRIFATGPLSPHQSKVLRALKEAKKSAEDLLRPGVSLHRLDAAARSVLKTYGYDEEFCHALGHGVGMEIHEGVVISSKRPDARLKKGDVITIEPGLYFDGKFGMRLEDTHIIT